MIKIRPPLVAPLMSILLLLLGSGFYTTLTTANLEDQNIATWVIGCVSSAYYIGFLISGFRAQHLIVRVGHIRAFAIFAAGIAVSVIIQGVFFSPTLWVALRFISGFSLAGICVVVESWLLDSSSERDRGAVLALYMLIYYIAQAVSQLFMNISYETLILAYCLITIFSILAILPVCMTRFQAPSPEDPRILSLKYVFKRAPIGVVGSIISGLILGPTYTLVPWYLKQNNKDNELGYIMMAIILGGTLLQYPVGKLSDHFDRRYVMVTMGIGAIITYILFIPDIYTTAWLMFLGFWIGGTTFTFYPLAISYTVDNMHRRDMVSAISTMCLAYGIGSATGPLIAPVFTEIMGPNGLCVYFLICSMLFVGYTSWRIRYHKVMPYEEHVDYQAAPYTTPETVPVEQEPVAEVVIAPEEIQNENRQG